MSTQTIDFFTQIPNEYIRRDIKSDFNLSRKFYIIYILVERNSTKEGISKVSMNEILEACGLNSSRKREDINNEIVSIIDHMVEMGFVQVLNDISKIKRCEPILFKLQKSLFYEISSYTYITYKQFDNIIGYKGNIRIENLLSVFLYIRSYIGTRPNNITNNIYPMSFYKNSVNVASDLGMSHAKVLECLKALTSGEYIQPIFRRELLFDNKTTAFPLYVYVLNEPGYEREIELTKKYLNKHNNEK